MSCFSLCLFAVVFPPCTVINSLLHHLKDFPIDTWGLLLGAPEEVSSPGQTSPSSSASPHKANIPIPATFVVSTELAPFC